METLKIQGRLGYFKQRNIVPFIQGEMAISGKVEKSLNRINRETLYSEIDWNEIEKGNMTIQSLTLLLC